MCSGLAPPRYFIFSQNVAAFQYFSFRHNTRCNCTASVKGVENWKSYPRRCLWGGTKKLGGIVDTSSRFGFPSLLWGTFGHNCSCKFKVRRIFLIKFWLSFAFTSTLLLIQFIDPQPRKNTLAKNGFIFWLGRVSSSVGSGDLIQRGVCT